jgi:hypothetical protein
MHLSKKQLREVAEVAERTAKAQGVQASDYVVKTDYIVVSIVNRRWVSAVSIRGLRFSHDIWWSIYFDFNSQVAMAEGTHKGKRVFGVNMQDGRPDDVPNMTEEEAATLATILIPTLEIALLEFFIETQFTVEPAEN